MLKYYSNKGVESEPPQFLVRATFCTISRLSHIKIIVPDFFFFKWLWLRNILQTSAYVRAKIKYWLFWVEFHNMRTKIHMFSKYLFIVMVWWQKWLSRMHKKWYIFAKYIRNLRFNILNLILIKDLKKKPSYFNIFLNHYR